jgi:hypothetical protein
MGKKMLMKSGIKPNVFVGGVASYINSATDLVQLFGGVPGNYLNLKKDGDNISFYSTNMNMTMNYGNAFAEDLKRNRITYIKQEGFKCRFSLYHRCFYHVTKLQTIELENTEQFSGSHVIGGGTQPITTIILPSVFHLGSSSVLGIGNLVVLEIPKCTILGLNSLDYSATKLDLLDIKKCKTIGPANNTGVVFAPQAFTSTAVLNVNSTLLTNNSGAVNYYLQDLKTRKPGVTINFYDDFGNYVSTL